MEVIGSGLRRSFDCRPEKRGAKGIAFVSKVPNDGEGILRWHEHTTSHAHTSREGPKLPDRTRLLIRTSSIHPPRLGAGFMPTIHLVHANRLKSKRQRSKRTDLANSRIPSRQPTGQADVSLAHGKMRSVCNIRDGPSTNIAAQFDFQHDCLTHGLFEDLAVRCKDHWKRNSLVSLVTFARLETREPRHYPNQKIGRLPGHCVLSVQAGTVILENVVP